MSMYVYESLVSSSGGKHRIRVPDFKIDISTKDGEIDALTQAIGRMRALIMVELNRGKDPVTPSEVTPEGSERIVALPVDVEPTSGLFFTIEEVADILGVTRTRVSNLIHDGVLDSVRLGSRRLISRSSLYSYLETPRQRGKRISHIQRTEGRVYCTVQIKVAGSEKAFNDQPISLDPATTSAILSEAVLGAFDSGLEENRKRNAQRIMDGYRLTDFDLEFDFAGHNYYSANMMESILDRVDEIANVEDADPNVVRFFQSARAALDASKGEAIDIDASLSDDIPESIKSVMQAILP